jgi:hypothetical protein
MRWPRARDSGSRWNEGLFEWCVRSNFKSPESTSGITHIGALTREQAAAVSHSPLKSLKPPPAARMKIKLEAPKKQSCALFTQNK